MSSRHTADQSHSTGSGQDDGATTLMEWQYTPEENEARNDDSTSQVTWSASEFIDHEKSVGWFLAVAGLGVVISGVVYLLTRDIINSAVIIVFAGLFATSGARRPRTLQYDFNNRGIQIGDKFYPYSAFKSFAIMDEGVMSSLHLLQLKRFAPPITLYYPPEQEDEIVNFLGNYLPLESRVHDPIEKLMRRVRF